MVLHFAYPYLAYIFIPLLLLVLIYRLKWYQSPVYQFPLTQQLADSNNAQKKSYRRIVSLLRFITLTGLAFLILRPQWADERSKINVEGIDIVLAIDVSGSMTYFDDIKDQRARIDVAKLEAVRFIEKRIDDPIGVVIFGKEAVCQCPLTLDKQILKNIVGSLEIGIIDYQETWLGTGLALAINRLRSSKAKSKIVILLTDGQPSPSETINPELAIKLAHQFGIKVYTIGIGSEETYAFDQLHRIHRLPGNDLNVELLTTIAEKTGGVFFQAKNPADMRKIYDTIDRLEKTKHQTDIFHRYYEAFLSFIWIILLAFGLELVLRTFVWRGVW